MPSNYLEQLVAEWYEYQGYFVRRNVLVGKRAKGGWEAELDVVAFDPRGPDLVHYETSMDALSWAERDRRFEKKFAAGRKYIPEIFPGILLPSVVKQRALLYFASKKNRDTVGGQPLVLVSEFLAEVLQAFREKRVASAAIPEHLPILRTLQIVVDQRKALRELLCDSTTG